MKKVGFKRRINIDWSDPLMVLFIVFILTGLFIALIVTICSAWKELWLMPTILGGIGIFFGIFGFITQLLDS